jgi:hypothetical protein
VLPATATKEHEMTRTLVLSFAGALAATVLTFSVANASPVGGSMESLRATAASQGVVEQARCWRRCWWHNGHRHCRRHCRWWW